jgi:serine/threonine protein kinase
VSWDGSDEDKTTQALSPLLVLELAYDAWPTIQAYYENKSHEPSYADDTGFISDIADGLSALHRCGVIHGDLKPDNVLLFEEPSGTGKFVAKLNDFGFSKVSVTDDIRRGRSKYWDAPECLDDPSYTQERISASDVYSFGLVAMYIALGGGDPLEFEGLKAKDIERIKANDEARIIIGAKLRAHYQGLTGQEMALQSYISLMNETLERSPKKRLASLDGVRLRLTKEYGSQYPLYSISNAKADTGTRTQNSGNRISSSLGPLAGFSKLSMQVYRFQVLLTRF